MLILQNPDASKFAFYAFDDIDTIIDHSQNKGKIPNDPRTFKNKYKVCRRKNSVEELIVYSIRSKIVLRKLAQSLMFALRIESFKLEV